MDAEPEIEARLQAALARLDAAMAGLADTMEALGNACTTCCERAASLIDDLDTIASGATRREDTRDSAVI
jgi:hypothetical protein